MKKGFTLIEILAVIIVLGVIALITYPTINGVIENSKEKALTETKDGLLKIANLYSTENMLDKTTNETAIQFSTLLSLGYIKTLPKDTVTGENLSGCLLYAWASNQYTFRYDENCIAKSATPIPMTITFNPIGTLTNGWYNAPFYVQISVSGDSFKWCSSTSDCTPTTLVSSNNGSAYISLQSSSDRVCVIGYDYINYSEKECSPLYKLDKISPVIAGVTSINVAKNTVVDLTTGVSATDEMSGLNGTYNYSPTSVDTSTSGVKTVVYNSVDNAGNSASVTKTITVETTKPSIAFTSNGTFNGGGWANSNFYITATATPDSNSSISKILWCSGTSSCTPTTTVTSNTAAALISNNSATNIMCAKAIDATGNSSDVVCSSNYKLDKVAPTITANSGTVEVKFSESHVVSTYFSTPTYGISGASSFVCDPINTSSLAVGARTISCTATGANGLVTTASKNITVLALCEYTVNQQFNFGYTGAIQNFTAACTGTYKLETWGAQGGNTVAADLSTTIVGGYGGYALGVYNFLKNDIANIYVGGQGSSGSNAGNVGGYNGGGATVANTSYGNSGGGGGGASDIRLGGTALTNRIIVAGGGGGGAYFYSTIYGTNTAGSGGGINGVTSGTVYNASAYAYGATGGTDSTGGAGGTGGANGSAGVLGIGGASATSTSSVGGGGGGGYFGGGGGAYQGTGANVASSGAGGSGYIGGVTSNATYSITKAMYCYNCTTSAASGTLTYTTTNASATATSSYAKLGNGYARITYLGE